MIDDRGLIDKTESSNWDLASGRVLFIDRSFPRTWWDAFKERWFPGWLVRLFPVEYERIYVNETLYEEYWYGESRD